MEQDAWRAQHYALLATLLAAPPAQSLLENIAAVEISDPESEMGRAWLQLKQAAGAAEADALKQEFDDLFIGLTQGEVIPYGSYYQTGFLHEKPLAGITWQKMVRYQSVSLPRTPGLRVKYCSAHSVGWQKKTNSALSLKAVAR